MTEHKSSLARRDFLGAGLLILSPAIVKGSQANSAVRVGLLGCGGRGTADASGMMESAGARVTAVADLFEDQATRAKQHFDGLAGKLGRAGVERVYTGPKAAQEIANSKEVDAVVIATPPYFHPEHLGIVIDGGKHAYCEKPVAVDVAGTKGVAEIGKKAKGKLTLHVGFQIRKAPPFVELVRRIHGGALGRIASGEAFYFCPLIERPAFEKASPTERRLRNWIYDRVLSGDIIVEQNVHVLDICNWTLNAHPIKAVGKGGRTGRTEPGDASSHFNLVFEYPNGIHVGFSSCQFGKVAFDANERFMGTMGSSSSPYAGPIGITGQNAWQFGESKAAPAGGEFSATGSFSDNLAQADPEKHRAFISSIAEGRFDNDTDAGVETALTGILGRTAAYTGREVTWDELVRSNEKWDAKLDVSKLG
ncbi:MAG TPA: Gfo/Idh/MocA family oxidoreductase [Bryobacteraceae bacterium]|nr:Gfo/Idh/MocA family oxidoreductase [Bryobacteraceae bacterium]